MLDIFKWIIIHNYWVLSQMKYKDIDKIMSIVNILKENFDGKVTNFPEIRSVINNTQFKYLKNNIIRQILFYLERIGAVKIQKGLSGHLTMYNDIVIEDYQFNFNGVYDYVIKRFEEKFSDHIQNGVIQVMVCNGKIIYSPLDNIEEMAKCTSPEVIFANVSVEDVKDYVRRLDNVFIIENLLTSSIENIIDNVVLKIVEGGSDEGKIGRVGNGNDKNKYKRDDNYKHKQHRKNQRGKR